jgi:single-strand DNA-binding protein
VCTFTVAVNNIYRNRDGETVKEADFFKVEAWNKLAEICAKYISQGKLVLVEGRLKNYKWQTDEGDKKENFVLRPTTITFLDSTPQQKSTTEKVKEVFKGLDSEENIDFKEEIDDAINYKNDDLPF